MTDLDRKTAPTRAQQLAADLTTREIAIPKEMRSKLDQLDRLDKARPTKVLPADLAEAMTNEDYGKAHELAVLTLTGPAVTAAWTFARETVAGQALRAATQAADVTVAALSELAAPVIANLTAAAATGDVGIAALVRDGRTAEAEHVAHVDLYVADLTGLYRLRDAVTRGADYGAEWGCDCRTWRDPRLAVAAVSARSTQASPQETYLLGIRAGAGLWFPTPDEASALGRTIADAEKKQRERNPATRAGYATFG